VAAVAVAAGQRGDAGQEPGHETPWWRRAGGRCGGRVEGGDKQSGGAAWRGREGRPLTAGPAATFYCILAVEWRGYLPPKTPSSRPLSFKLTALHILPEKKINFGHGGTL
jgi:hypothetical protein